MRAGGCTVQQGLTADAASVVKQAVSLARRRGHAQVTPLHVANAMLASSTGLLRTACLQSNSHPLQCKALELCFNVALNRLPASTSSPMLGHHSHHHPSLSNALVAAFKRAQAQQRRGSIENQQQPLLAVKVEIEQLIISILDDPSVSRVMKEAGFSSTQVKSNVEQTVSLEICSQTSPAVSSKSNKESNNNLLVLDNNNATTVSQPPMKVGKPNLLADQVRCEDITSVIEALMNRSRVKRNIVIIGECLTTAEGVVRGVMDKVDKGEVPHEALRDLQFISLPLASFGHLTREEVEHKIGELRCLVKSCVGRAAVLYLGDLKWVAEFRASSSTGELQAMKTNYYCPVEHIIIELGRVVIGFGESGRLWLMGIATFQTYMRCRVGHPSLETVWGLHPLTIPAGSLSLSLSPDSSDLQGQSQSRRSEDGSAWLLVENSGMEKQQLTCCTDCSIKFETEARSLVTSAHNSPAISTTSSLPSWLQQYKEERTRPTTSNDQESLKVRDLCKKWNTICNVVDEQHHHHHHHHLPERTINFSSVSPSSSTSICSYEQHCSTMHQTLQGWPISAEPKSWTSGHHHQQFWVPETVNHEDATLKMYLPEHGEPKQSLFAISTNPNSKPPSISCSMETEHIHRFKELNYENLRTLCDALEEKVPWQKDIIPEIVSTILQCRSGMMRRKEKAKNYAAEAAKEDTWLFFQGADYDAKEKIARELACLVFGSLDNFTSIGLSSFSSPRADSAEELKNKRSRDEASGSYLERLADAIRLNPHRVLLVEDVEQVDYCSQLGIKRAIEKGMITTSSGEQVWLSDAIIVLSCESFSSRSRACSPPVKSKLDESTTEEDQKVSNQCNEDTSPCTSWDLNLSAQDQDNVDDESIDDIGLLESVDRRIIFNLQELQI
ncbi:hypothetical protein Sjap_012472 [Stephania japonica]|uniref:Clp R domain-containing protein n=1 Tax=Stephania japonica TaxID=461633 RepID=A0AAP0IWT5_9MAGN